ncbi:MAG: YceH family protein [Xanthomonadaceae bacterium]|jgi:hypothetical protein|nr:YceH family protein [Xanthomonadaceae bacterium]
MSASDATPPLDAVQARILGCLVEKAATTPDAYPLTENALVMACNQKTSREPVMDLEPGVVGHGLRQLEDRGMVRVVHGARALRYEHRFDEAFTVTPRQRAVLCLLLLRGPQTQAELLARAERLAAFPSLDDVRDTLDRLIARQPPLVVRLPRGAGQREDRYMHLLSGIEAAEAAAARLPAAPLAAAASSDLLARIDALEARIAALESRLPD